MIPISLLAAKHPTVQANPILALSNLLWYYDTSVASSVTQASNKVSGLTDLSPAGKNANQSVANDKPTFTNPLLNGLSGLTFAAANFLNIASVNLGIEQWSIGMLAKTPATFTDGNPHYYFNNYTADLYTETVDIGETPGRLVCDIHNDPGDNIDYYTFTTAGALTVNTWYRFVVVWDGTLADPNKGQFYVDAVNVTVPGSIGTLNSPRQNGHFAWGDEANGFTSPNPQVEYFAVAQSLSSTQISSIDAYWTNKWAL